jgi:hypothetical protein
MWKRDGNWRIVLVSCGQQLQRLERLGCSNSIEGSSCKVVQQEIGQTFGLCRCQDLLLQLSFLCIGVDGMNDVSSGSNAPGKLEVRADSDDFVGNLSNQAVEEFFGRRTAAAKLGSGLKRVGHAGEGRILLHGVLEALFHGTFVNILAVSIMDGECLRDATGTLHFHGLLQSGLDDLLAQWHFAVIDA